MFDSCYEHSTKMEVRWKDLRCSARVLSCQLTPTGGHSENPGCLILVLNMFVSFLNLGWVPVYDIDAIAMYNVYLASDYFGGNRCAGLCLLNLVIFVGPPNFIWFPGLHFFRCVF